MTSRDATALLPRRMPLHAGPVSARLAVAAFSLVQWPWLLKSLRGGSRKAKAALLDRLELPRDALPHLGSWKADTGFLNLIVDTIAASRPRTVVEFGTGASTLVVARALEMNGGGALISHDQHADFVEATRAWLSEHGLTADLRAARLEPTPDWPGLWYRSRDLPQHIDLMIVDGPPWTVHPFTRGAAATLFDRIAPGGTILLDDAARPGERIVAERWRREWPEFDFELVKSGTKGTLVGRRRADAGREA